MKRANRIIYVTGTHAWLFEGKGDALSVVAWDECNPKHVPSFVEGLGATPTVPTYVVFDVIDEQYNVGSVPHARGADRKAVLRRHAEKIFRNSPYRYTVIQGRQTQGRKDDVVLTTSIVNPDLVAPLLEKLRQQSVAVAGVCSLPVVSGEILKDLPKAGSQRLVVTQQSSGLRLTFFQDRKLKMSRLTPIREDGPESVARQIRDEVDKTQKYLGRLRLTAHDAELTIHLLVEDGMMGPVLVECVDGGNLRYTINPISQWLTAVDIKDGIKVAPADCLMAQLVLQKGVSDHYGTAQDKRYAGMYRSARQMRQVGAAAVVASVFAAGFYIWNSQQLDIARDQASLDEQRYLREANAIESRLPTIPLPAKELKAAVRAAQKLVNMQVLPTDVFARLSQALAKYPQLKIMQVYWRTVSPDDMILEEVISDEADAPVEDSTYDDDGRFRMRYVTTVTAELDNFDGNYLGANREIRSLLDGLLADGYFSSAKIIKSSVSDAAQDALTGEFDPRKGGDDEKPEVTFEAVVERMYEP